MDILIAAVITLVPLVFMVRHHVRRERLRHRIMILTAFHMGRRMPEIEKVFKKWIEKLAENGTKAS